MGYIVSIGLIQALNESIETGKNYGYLELVEEGIKCLEMISYDSVYLVDDLIYSLIATKDRSIYLLAKEVIVDITFLLRIKS